MSSQAVVLILGAGPNIGQHVSRAFAAKGYKAAMVSRSIKKEDDSLNQTNFQFDLSDPFSIPEVFAKVKDTIGLPSVVIYNGE
jgi:NAD(P)-dependent dehydrogenase (short-subunit alcohol dehydrogenase family)